MFQTRSIPLHSSESIDHSPELGQENSTPQVLTPIGWDASRIAEFVPHASANLEPGRVARVDGQSVVLITLSGTTRAESSTRLQAEAETAEVLPATGDWVGFSARPSHDTDLIEVRLARRSQLMRTRQQVMKSAVERQVVAVNLDVVFIVHSANNLNVRRLEREAAQVASSGAEVVIVLNKADLVTDVDVLLAEATMSVPHVPVHVVSGVTGEGVDSLSVYARPDRTLAFIGASGVGKSTLINRLLGREAMDTGAVREDDQRGRHTTTTRNLLPLDGGGALIDTPGVRSLGLSDASDGVEAVFDDVTTLALECRFADCSHFGEPDCAVQEAIRSGELEEGRLSSFGKLSRETEYAESKTDVRLRHARRDLLKARTKSARQATGKQRKSDRPE
jgi:ribosome biogenesis GTPase